MICSRLASAVSINTGIFLSFSSERTALIRSRPDMPGMFQSEIRKSKLPACNMGRAVFPSSASVTFGYPRSCSRFLMIRRMVEKSSTTRNFISLLTASISHGPTASGPVHLQGSTLSASFAPVAEPRLQSHQRLPVQLAYARLGNLQHRPYLLQVESVAVVERHDQPFALGQSIDRAAQSRPESFIRRLAERVGRSRSRCGSRIIQACKAATRRVLHDGVVFIQTYSQAL